MNRRRVKGYKEQFSPRASEARSKLRGAIILMVVVRERTKSK